MYCANIKMHKHHSTWEFTYKIRYILISKRCIFHWRMLFIDYWMYTNGVYGYILNYHLFKWNPIQKETKYYYWFSCSLQIHHSMPIEKSENIVTFIIVCEHTLFQNSFTFQVISNLHLLLAKPVYNIDRYRGFKSL